jgi:hypothetical protein
VWERVDIGRRVVVSSEGEPHTTGRHSSTLYSSQLFTACTCATLGTLGKRNEHVKSC